MSTRKTLFRKYAPIFCVLIGGVLLLSGMIGVNYSHQANKDSLTRVQREKAEAAAARFGQYLFDVEIRAATTGVTMLGALALEQRAAEIRLLRHVAAIKEAILIDPQGKEYFRVSRLRPETIRGGEDYSNTVMFREAKAGRSYRSPVRHSDGALYMMVALPVGALSAGITVIKIDLEFLLDGITHIKVGEAGHAYAVDSEGRLIAHPDLGLVLNKTSLAWLPQVQAAIVNPDGGLHDGVRALSQNGDEVLSAFGWIPQLGWFVFVEEPISSAYRLLYEHAIRSALLVLFGTVVTLVISLLLIRRMVRPVHALQEGARRIGDGLLDHRIAVRTGDELEDLADEFNRMAEQLQKSYATLEGRVAERTRELEESNAMLAELSTTDALTGIANRRRFDEVLAVEWSRAARSGQSLALAMIDVDWFKVYNDYYGHRSGDQCLQQVAAVLAETICRKGDLVARYGGEEFVFIAPATDGENATQMARRVCDALHARAIPHELSSYGRITVSIGVASRVPRTGDSPEGLVKDADEAMYRAKALGRNRVVLD